MTRISNRKSIKGDIHSEYDEYREGVIQREKSDLSKILKRDLKIRAKNNSQIDLIKSVKHNDVTICAGKAGTGKTFVVLATALELLRKRQSPYTKIYLVKSVTTLKGEEIGYLKGGLDEKIEPFMMSYKFNLNKLLDSVDVSALLSSKVIEPFPLAFARGVSLDNCIVIVDEMQNVSLTNARTILTRMGENCKMILMGDTNQVDMKNAGDSSLNSLLNMFSNSEGIGVVEMDSKYVNVRNPLIDIIERGFDNYGK